jgi:Domain of unknown function (DUF4167)
MRLAQNSGNRLHFIRTEKSFMNNRQTSRRRGRGNNNGRPQNNNRNGYDNQNRVDNRARGNASQMLEKYKKLAQDAQHVGDRVNAEYYLQFADHYFRVLADYRSRQEEGRPQREWRDDNREGGEDRDWRDEERDVREEGDESESPSEPSIDEDDYRRPQRAEREPREPREARPPREDRGNRNDRGERNENRNDRGERNPRNRNNNRDRNEGRDRDVAREEVSLDLSILPPAIGIANDDDVVVAEEKPARKPRARRPKASEDGEIATAAE